jgi:hypothetical protein
VNEGASGDDCSVDGAVVAAAPTHAPLNGYVTAARLTVNAALVVTPEQADMDQSLARAAALCGTSRLAVPSRGEAEA